MRIRQIPLLKVCLVLFSLSEPLLGQDEAAAPDQSEAEESLAPQKEEQGEEEASTDDATLDAEAPAPLEKPLSEIRSDKNFGLSFRYGLFVSPVMGPGFDFFYQIKPALQVGAMYFNGTLDLKNHLSATDNTTIEKHELAATLSMLYARYFLGDSFYLAGGLGQRTVKTNYEIRSTVAHSQMSAKNTALNEVVNIHLGNLWSWEKGFFAGIDWVGYTIPLSHKDDTNTKTTGSDAPPDALKEKQEKAEDLFKDIGKLGTWQYLTFHVGYSF